MHVTQPTISSGVSELETKLGVKLFNRGGRGVELTMEGRSLVNYAVQIQDLVEEASDLLSRGDGGGDEGFQFGSIDAAVIYLLPEILRAYIASHPDIALSVQVAPSRYLADDLLMNRSEFAFITLPFEHARLDTLSLYEDRVLLVVGSTHRFAGRRSVTLEDVAGEPLILFHDDSVSRRIVDEKFAEAGLSPTVVMAMRSPEAMRKLVEAGVGISFLPYLTVQDALKSGELKEVPVKGVNFKREIGVAWRKGRYFGPAIEDLMAAIVEAFEKTNDYHTLRGK